MAWFYQWFELLAQLSLSGNSLTEEDLGPSDLLRRYFQGKLERETGQGRRQAKQGRGFRQCPSWPHLEPKGELWGILNPLRALPEAKNLDYLVWYQLDIYLVLCASLLRSDSKESAAMRETQSSSSGWEDHLEKGMPTHFRVLPGEFHGQRSLTGYSPQLRD